MKKRDLYRFKTGLNMTKFEHPRVTYGVNKNKRMIKEVIEDMEKIIKPSPEMDKFFKGREELAKTHSFKDEAGNPKLKKMPRNSPGESQMMYDIEGQADEKSVYRKALAKLAKEYDAEIKKHDEKVKKYNEEFLDDDTEFEPFMVPLTLMEAHEKCPQPIMDEIFWMVDDTK